MEGADPKDFFEVGFVFYWHNNIRLQFPGCNRFLFYLPGSACFEVSMGSVWAQTVTTQVSYAVAEAWVCSAILSESMAEYFLRL